MSALLYVVCSIFQIYAGIRVGAGTELGTLHICFGIYIAIDALIEIGKHRKKAKR